MIIIKIPTLSDLRIWMNKEAGRRTIANWDAIEKLRKEILYHVNREPIPDENKKYLTRHIDRAFSLVRLYNVWGKPKDPDRDREEE